MRRQKKEDLARWMESLGRKIAQEPHARSSKLDDEVCPTGVGDK